MKNMDKSKLQTLKGFRDFLPKEAKKRLYAINKIQKTLTEFGFEPLETPALEYEEILLGKYGEDADKLVYRFKDLGGRNVAMRYDQTVPTARVLAMYNQSLPMPWRRYQIQPVWRADNTQAGRYREFLQCDADIYGTRSPLADAEIIALASDLYKNLGFENFKIYINDRNILYELMYLASIPKEQYFAVIATIDKLDRKTKDEVKKDLIEMGLDEKMIDHLYHHLDLAKPTDLLNEIMNQAKKLGVNSDNLVFEARLARGLDYYTSTIFEIKIDKYKGGSVLGGGRYNNLIKQLSGTDIPAIGFAVGFDRTLEAMEQFNLFPSEGKRKGALVSMFNKDLAANSLEVAKVLRENNITCEIYPNDETKLDKQLKYADKKLIKWFIVIGPDEDKKETAIVKNLQTGHQDDVKLARLVKYFEQKGKE